MSETEIYTRSRISLSLPLGKNFLVWLSHDVDRVRKTFFHALYYALKDRRAGHLTSFLGSGNPYWNFDHIRTLEDRYGVRSTFFFLNETMKADLFHPYSFVLAKGRYSLTEPCIEKVIRDLDQNGWEIGLHGSYCSYDNRDLLRQEKDALEKIVGHPIHGIRQHYLNLTVPGTWKIHQELGFRYDASFGLTDDIGWRDGIDYPFQPFQTPFTVFPITIMDSTLFPKYRTMDTIWQKCLEIIELARSRKTLLSLLWHQRVFNDHDFPGYGKIYERLIEECRNQGAEFCTGKNIHSYLNHNN